MNNQIDINQSVSEVIIEHPELVDILIDLGFTPLNNSAMINTLGKVISLKQGCQFIHIPTEKLIEELAWNGYEVIGDD